MFVETLENMAPHLKQLLDLLNPLLGVVVDVQPHLFSLVTEKIRQLVQ